MMFHDVSCISCPAVQLRGINTVRFDITPQQPIGNVPNTRLRVLAGDPGGNSAGKLWSSENSLTAPKFNMFHGGSTAVDRFRFLEPFVIYDIYEWWEKIWPIFCQGPAWLCGHQTMPSAQILQSFTCQKQSFDEFCHVFPFRIPEDWFLKCFHLIYLDLTPNDLPDRCQVWVFSPLSSQRANA